MYYSLSKYGDIPSSHSMLLNDHFNEIIDHFNERYSVEGGVIGSLKHQMALEKASSYVAQMMIEEAKKFVGRELDTMDSFYEFDVDELGLTICVDVKTTQKTIENSINRKKPVFLINPN